MINSVRNVSFGTGADIIGQPGKYSSQPASSIDMSMPSDTFEKKSHTGRNLLITGLVLLGGFLGLGFAVKKGKLAKLEELPEGFFKKNWARVKNFAATIGEYGEKTINKVGKLFSKKSAEKTAEAAENAA